MVDNHVTFLLSVATLYTMLAISPGPNFLVITQAAISRSRWQALCIAFGVSTASVIWASLAALGLAGFKRLRSKDLSVFDKLPHKSAKIAI